MTYAMWLAMQMMAGGSMQTMDTYAFIDEVVNEADGWEFIWNIFFEEV